jgi:CO/xanthine dehydrogenase Mo-binding subunit
MSTTTQHVSEQPNTYRVLGTRPIRHDGLDKVTGAAKYGADLQLAGMLHGMILRSPHPHANILSIDTRQAAALPGVRALPPRRTFRSCKPVASTSPMCGAIPA